ELRIKNQESRIIKLLKADDKNKDQSYFLYTLTQKKLKHCLFPLGKYTKIEVRELAKKYQLPAIERDESQEICFIQSKYYGDFLRKYLKLVPGKIVDVKNNVLGEHKGLPLYTMGQRRDIGIGGTGPYYVIGINKRKNQLVVSNNKNDKNLFSKELIVKKVNWISGNVPKFPLKIKAKTRYRMKECPVVVNKIKGKYIVKFSKPQRAVMPGQSVVFYKGSEILGGGIII
ncbi:MAG: tRNA 2-thiouridine(34) synthase MnmA, partial [Candidatus Pacebacteria bacterium]|nr:tRNA 2-thiouridine(34) synthase MnmA [Candidatus Paceibacterota bacterium]